MDDMGLSVLGCIELQVVYCSGSLYSAARNRPARPRSCVERWAGSLLSSNIQETQRSCRDNEHDNSAFDSTHAKDVVVERHGCATTCGDSNGKRGKEPKIKAAVQKRFSARGPAHRREPQCGDRLQGTSRRRSLPSYRDLLAFRKALQGCT